MSYCVFVAQLPTEPASLHRSYHDERYGFPVHDDNELFGRLILEINQAGLSWSTILNKEANFLRAYDKFDIDTVAAYSEADRERLLQDAGIIRNRLKVNAAIHNAQVIQGLQKEHGSFKAWLDQHHPMSKEEWVRLFRKTFKFTGGEIVGEFLMSTGYLPGAHDEDCPVHRKAMKAGAAWTRQSQSK
ncbi:DNA-3-methyladenine glycosylase [Advenella kashmirensis W13003]|uniref:DNA-3-methyladenine glycosylase n=1 Tax=Advenella kashmirensis W13003 TaxID=1424334 RepID=V8QW42_9BURK|nr:DNA-3-methyladenine glycosylase I [Advenella kashmirensis]ETF03548.1 DNA-3-methyladenine glycosylase [Advenella kashmirensis W13003]